MNAPRKTSAKPAQTASKGGLTGPEKTKLVLLAKDAFLFQSDLGNIESGETFNSWRHAEVMASVERGGISEMDRSQWRTVAAHFLTLAGKEAEAFDMLQKTGKKSYRPAGPGDTWESSEALVAKIREELAMHLLATLPEGQSHIHPGWFLSAARQRTSKPTLTMDTLAERLDPVALTGLLSHLRTHIARREGRPPQHPAKRVYPPKQDPGEMSFIESDPF